MTARVRGNPLKSSIRSVRRVLTTCFLSIGAARAARAAPSVIVTMNMGIATAQGIPVDPLLERVYVDDRSCRGCT
jgi:hypothetical protein